MIFVIISGIRGITLYALYRFMTYLLTYFTLLSDYSCGIRCSRKKLQKYDVCFAAFTLACNITVTWLSDSMYCKAADTRPTNVGQHVVGKQKSVVCSKSWPTFYVGQQCLRFTNLFVFCWPTSGKPCVVIGWL